MPKEREDLSKIESRSCKIGGLRPIPPVALRDVKGAGSIWTPDVRSNLLSLSEESALELRVGHKRRHLCAQPGSARSRFLSTESRGQLESGIQDFHFLPPWW